MFHLIYDLSSPTTFIDYIQSGGVIALLFLILYGGIRKWWVFGWYYNELKERHIKLAEERDGWKELALRSANLAESVNELARSRISP